MVIRVYYDGVCQKETRTQDELKRLHAFLGAYLAWLEVEQQAGQGGL